MLRAFCIALGLLVSHTVYAETNNQNSWYVTGVASNDTLSARAGPGVSYPKTGRLAHDARDIKTVVCVPTFSVQKYQRLSAADRRVVDAAARWCLVSFRGREEGWVNARYLADDGANNNFESGQNVDAGSGASKTQHDQICATYPQVNVALSDPQLWRMPSGQRAVDVVHNRSPNWDSAMRWFSAWQDAVRGVAKGETSYDFSVQFCSCGQQQASYDITRIRVDDRAEIFFDGTNWQDIAVNFRANNPAGRANKSNAQDFNRSLMLRIHNDPGTQDNPLGFAIEGRLKAQNSYLGYCQK